jgi:uncharacterized integral membrane protein
MRSDKHDPQDLTPVQPSPASAALANSIVRPARDEFPPPDTDRAREAAARAITPAVGETRGGRFRRNARRGRLHGYALAVLALVAILIALAAANTARVRVDWLVSSSRVSLVWLMLVAAIIGWILGVLASARIQWLTRAPRIQR